MKPEQSPRRTRSSTIGIETKSNQSTPRLSKKLKTTSGSTRSLKRTPGSKSKRTPGKENKIERESKERQEDESRSLPDTSTCVENKSQNEKIEARSAISTPSKAFATPSKGSASILKTKTPLAKYLQDAKQVFRRCSTPSKLVGRNSERQIITDFIMENINNFQSGKNKNHSGALYISGLPGTGKSALVNEILQSESFSAKPSKKKPIFAFINCMTVTAKTIFKHLVKEFGLEDDTQEDLITLQKFVTHPGPAVILILDEIDHLVSKDQDVLYNFFELASNTDSRLCLIGIANALDLTSRFLPRLKAKNFNPMHLSFLPYKVEEISDIIKDRLSGLEPGTPLTPSMLTKDGLSQQPGTPTMLKCLMQPMAIELAARKLAGTGDLRKALDVCRHAIALVEGDENPQVTIKHILKVTSSLLGSSNKSRIESLNSLAKIVLVVFSLLNADSRKIKDISVADLYGKYRNVAARHSRTIGCASYSEFQDSLGQLEVSGLIQYTSRKGVKILGLCASVDDVMETLKKSPLLESIIECGIGNKT